MTKKVQALEDHCVNENSFERGLPIDLSKAKDRQLPLSEHEAWVVNVPGASRSYTKSGIDPVQVNMSNNAPVISRSAYRSSTAGAQYLRSPKIAVPILTIVAPSSTATR